MNIFFEILKIFFEIMKIFIKLIMINYKLRITGLTNFDSIILRKC